MKVDDFVRHYKHKKHWGVIIECCLVDRGSVRVLWSDGDLSWCRKRFLEKILDKHF